MSNNELLISVIMSVFNADLDYLGESVKSILGQTYEYFEFIIVCDGDLKALEYLEKFKDKRIKLLVNESNQGLAYSLNKAIDESIGDFIFRMDADDISIRNRLEIQLKHLLKNNKIISSSCIEIDSNGHRIGKSKRYIFHNFILRFLLYKTNKFNPVVHSSIAARKEVFEDFKYDESILYAQDYELWKRMSRKYKISFIPQYLIYYRKSTINQEKKIYQDIVSRNLRIKK